MKLKEGEEKQRRARKAREEAEAEKAARAARKRALVDMNAHETQEGVMDSLLEALNNGSAFNRPEQRRKRQTRVAGGKLYRTFIERQMAKKDQATQAYIFSNTLDKSARLMHGYENLTPTEITRRDMLPNRIMAEICTAGDSTNFFTPEENQEIYKRMLIDEAKKTPRQTKYSSRVTFFQKRKLCSRCNNAYYTGIVPVFDETPKRDILLKTFRNLESRCEVMAERDLSPLVGENVSFDRACMLSPVKQRRVIVNKIRRRNSIVRRTILNRKHIRASNTIAKRRRLHACLQSPPSMNITMPPIVNTPNCVDTNSNEKMSKSIDDLHTKIIKPAFAPIRLLRSKNFENLTRYDENQNLQDLRNGSLNLSISTQFSSNEQIIKAQSPLVTEISGVMLLSENSPLHLIKSNPIRAATYGLNVSGETSGLPNSYKRFVSETSNSDAINLNKLRKPKDRSWKKKWKFWQAPINSI